MDDVGNVKLCESDEIAGNVRHSSLKVLWQMCNALKDIKYGESRWRGLCFPKRNEGIINGHRLHVCSQTLAQRL